MAHSFFLLQCYRQVLWHVLCGVTCFERASCHFGQETIKHPEFLVDLGGVDAIIVLLSSEEREVSGPEERGQMECVILKALYWSKTLANWDKPAHAAFPHESHYTHTLFNRYFSNSPSNSRDLLIDTKLYSSFTFHTPSSPISSNHKSNYTSCAEISWKFRGKCVTSVKACVSPNIFP